MSGLSKFALPGIALMLGASGCGAGLQASTAATRQAVPRIVVRHLTNERAFQLPSGFRPLAITGDTAGPGAWVVATDESDIRLFQLAAGGKIVGNWLVTSLAGIGGVGEVALSTAGTSSPVWIGLRDRLFEFSPSRGRMSAYVVPKLPLNPAAAASIPTRYRSFRNITSVAAMPDGSVTLIEDRAAAMGVMSRDGHFSDFRLPTNAVATGVASDRQGNIAAALLTYPGGQMNEALLRQASGRSAVVHTPSGFVAASSSAGFLAGAINLSSVQSLSATEGTQPAGIGQPAPSTGPFRAIVGLAPVTLAGGATAYGTASGIAVAPSFGTTLEYVFPSFSCAHASGQSALSASTTSQICAAFPESLTTDQQGDIWYESSAPDGGVGEIAASDYLAAG